MRSLVTLLLTGFLLAVAVFGQSTSATITGRVVDQSTAVISGAKVDVIDTETNTKSSTTTNRDGLYTVPGLKPGTYRIEVAKEGFKTALRPDVVLHVQDTVALNFTLPLGAVSESVTVTGEGSNVNTTDATVSTVIDRNFVANTPLNGRSFQD